MTDAREVVRGSALTPAAAPPGLRRSGSRAVAREKIDALTRLLDDQAPDEVEDLRRLLSDTETLRSTRRGSSVLDESLWGPSPSREDIAAGVVADLRRRFAGRRSMEEVSLSRTEVAELLAISPQAVTDALEARRLLGVRRGRSWLIPAWQLDAEAERGLLPGIGALAEAFPGGLVTLSAWVVQPHVDLDGRSPRDAMALGDGERVTALARSLNAAG